MWETIAIASIPAIITMTLTNFFNRKKQKAESEKHQAELKKIALEAKGSEASNMEAIFQNYNLVLTQTKIELADVNKRFSDYIEDANKKAVLTRARMSKLEKENRDLYRKVRTLSSTLSKLKNISEEDLFESLYGDEENDFTKH